MRILLIALAFIALNGCVSSPSTPEYRYLTVPKPVVNAPDCIRNNSNGTVTLFKCPADKLYTPRGEEVET